jgi:hypothetical protein
MRWTGWLSVVVLIGSSGCGDDKEVGGKRTPSQVTDTDHANPHVTDAPPASPNYGWHRGSSGGTGGGVPGDTGYGGTSGTAGHGGTTGAGGAAGTAGGGGAGAAGAGGMSGGVVRDWPPVDCVGGPCAAPNVCVNLDFLFVACVICGGNDQVCCPPYAADDPFLGTCDPGLVCGPNGNFQSSPPTDLVRNVCQVPGFPPPFDGGLNHQRLMIP